MPLPPYTGTRRTISQIILGLILAGTVALASLVDHTVNRSQTIAVSDPVIRGNMTVRIPRGWRPVPTQGTTTVVSVRERASGDEGRTLTVYRQRIGALRSPFEYLAAGGIVEPELVAGNETPFQPVTVAGSPGIIATFRYANTDDGQERKIIIACAVLPSRLAVTVKLDGAGAPDAGDVRLVERIASDIKLSDSPVKLPPGAIVKWSSGMSIKSPGEFRAVDDHDTQTTSRFLVDDRTPQGWASIEVTPCFYYTTDGASVLTTLLGAHDPRFFRAGVTELSPGQFRAIAPVEQAAMPTVAYVSADMEGHAILATFRGTPQRAAEFDAIWAEMNKSIQFGGTPYHKLLDAGRKQVAQIHAVGLDKLIPPSAREDLWWRWVDRFAGRTYGWSHFHFDQPSSWQATRETRKMVDKSLVVITQKWRSTPDLKSHTAKVDREVGSDPQSPPVSDFQQLLQVRDSRIEIAVSANGQSVPTMEAPLPPEFLPGAWMPHLLGHFEIEPMIIRTESLLGTEADFATAFQTLLISPAAPPDGSEAGTRVFTLEINGTGKLSRWTIRPDGQLDRVDFADGIYCELSDVEAIRLTFNGDQRMSP